MVNRKLPMSREEREQRTNLKRKIKEGELSGKTDGKLTREVKVGEERWDQRRKRQKEK